MSWHKRQSRNAARRWRCYRRRLLVRGIVVIRNTGGPLTITLPLSPPPAPFSFRVYHSEPVVIERSPSESLSLKVGQKVILRPNDGGWAILDG